MGIYEVEHIVAQRKLGGKDEYFIQWKDYSIAKNMWEPAACLAEELVAACEKDQSIQFAQMNAERDLLLYSRMPLELRGVPYLASKEKLV